MENQVKDTVKIPNLSRSWLMYFFLSIGLLGGMTGAVCLPLWCAGKIFRPLYSFSSNLFAFSVRVLLGIQPWLNAQVDIKIPERNKGNSVGVLTVSNHRSNLDMFFLLASLPGIRVVAKESLFRNPLLWPFLKMMGDFEVKTKDVDSYFGALESAFSALKQGDIVHIFPEMTRSEYGTSGTNHFALAPFRLAIQSGAQLVPIVFCDTDGGWPKGKVGVAYRHKIRIQSLPPINSRMFSSAEELKKHVQKQIDAVLAVYSSFGRANS